jgi:hypothetical protein
LNPSLARGFTQCSGAGALLGPLVLPTPASAQYLGSNFHGDFGVNSGSQPAPGLYVAIPFAQWNADSIKDADGNTVLGARFQGFDVRAVFPTMIIVTSKKVLGANYGFMVAPPSPPLTPVTSTLGAASAARRTMTGSWAAAGFTGAGIGGHYFPGQGFWDALPDTRLKGISTSPFWRRF